MKRAPTITALSVCALGCAVALAGSTGAPFSARNQGQKHPPAPGQQSGIGSNLQGPTGPEPSHPPAPQPPAPPAPAGSPDAPAPTGLPQVPVPGGSPPPAGSPPGSQPPAAAAASTAPDPGPGIWNRTFAPPSLIINTTTVAVGEGFRVTSAQFGEMISPTNWPITWPPPEQVPLQIHRTWAPAVNGMDLTYTLTNTTSQNVAMPQLLIPGYNMENQLQWLFHSPDTHFTTLTYTSGTSTVAPDVRYPLIMYAPIHVVRDSRFALGVALKYPVLEYKHDIRMIFRKNDDQTRWMTCVALDGMIGPGEVRTYTVTVRFMLPGDWIHTLEPYRDYLHAMYGELPHYTQDLRLVLGVNTSDVTHISPTNPRGFNPVMRVDLNGWTQLVDHVLNRATTGGYERVMVWKPSGLYNQHLENNFPPQIMTHWTAPMLTSESQWQRIPNAGINLGFWWGRTAQVADQWNDPTLETFNIHNPAHVALMLPEAQLCSSRGAATIGMDSFRMMNAWDAVPWLQQLGQINSNLRFIGEPSSNDVMNMFQPLYGASWIMTRAPILHDYLVPGREIWVLLCGQDANATLATQYIGWGMSVCVLSDTFAASEVASALEAAQHGWVLPPDAEVIPVPGPHFGD